MKWHGQKGFTIAELLIVVFILGVLALISAATFKSLRDAAALRLGVQEVHTAFLDSRNSSISSENNTVYGVHLSSTTVTRFVGDTYTAGASSNIVYTFEGGVMATSTFIENSVDIVFSRLTGEANATGSVTLSNEQHTASTTITINASGLVESE